MSVPGGSIEPSFQFSSITPSDTTKLSYTNAAGVVEPNRRCKALYIGSIASGSDLTVEDDAGNAVTFSGVVAGSIYPISTDRVMATNTTASSIVALF